MGSFTSFHGYDYLLMVFYSTSRWVQVGLARANDCKVAVKFVEQYISLDFFEVLEILLMMEYPTLLIFIQIIIDAQWSQS